MLASESIGADAGVVDQLIYACPSIGTRNVGTVIDIELAMDAFVSSGTAAVVIIDRVFTCGSMLTWI